MAQGSITKHVAKDGTISWRARADGGPDPGTGKRRQLMRTFKTRAEAQVWLREQQRRVDRGEWADAGAATLGEWIATWLDGPGTRGRRDATLRTYSSLLSNHVVPTLGATRLVRLGAAQLDALISGLETKLAPGSVALVYAALHTCLADAERLGVLVANPLRRVKCPGVAPVERPHWTDEEAARFLAAIGADEDRALWLAMLLAALRIGEALALTWEDCDFERGRLQVRRSLTLDRAGRLIIGDTTKSGRARTVPMPPMLDSALREQRAAVKRLQMKHRDVWTDRNLVFPGALGERRDDNAVRVRLRALCGRAGVPVVTPHAMRHTCASLLGERASAAEVRDLLGHHNLSVTNRYLHADGARQAAAVADLAARLGGR